MKTKSFFTQAEVVNAVATATVDLIARHESDVFNLVVTGGGLGIKSLQRIGELLDDPSRVRILFCDERFVDILSSDRNEAQALSVWPKIALCDFVRYPTPAQPVYDASREFSARLEALFGDVAAPGHTFDLILLGMGEDGHVASLFPNSTHESAWVVAEPNSPKPPRERLSLSYEALSRSERVWFVVGGASKIDALKRIQAGESLPAARVHGIKETVWWLDKEISDAL